MKIADSVTAMTIWAKSHWVLLFGFVLLIAFVALASWYYVSSLQQINRAVPERAEQKPPSVSTPIQSSPSVESSTSVDSTSIRTIIQSDGTSPTKTEVEVNGQPIEPPKTGSIHKVIQNTDGVTTVDISVDNNSSGTSSTQSSTNIELNSTSELNISSESSQ